MVSAQLQYNGNNGNEQTTEYSYEDFTYAKKLIQKDMTPWFLTPGQKAAYKALKNRGRVHVVDTKETRVAAVQTPTPVIPPTSSKPSAKSDKFFKPIPSQNGLFGQATTQNNKNQNPKILPEQHPELSKVYFSGDYNKVIGNLQSVKSKNTPVNMFFDFKNPNTAGSISFYNRGGTSTRQISLNPIGITIQTLISHPQSVIDFALYGTSPYLFKTTQDVYAHEVGHDIDNQASPLIGSYPEFNNIINRPLSFSDKIESSFDKSWIGYSRRGEEVYAQQYVIYSQNPKEYAIKNPTMAKRFEKDLGYMGVTPTSQSNQNLFGGLKLGYNKENVDYLVETAKAGGYVSIPYGMDFFNLKTVGFGTSYTAFKNRQAVEKDILAYNTEADLFSTKQKDFLGSGDILKLPTGEYFTTNPSKMIGFEKLDVERINLQSKGENLNNLYAASLTKEKLEKSKTFESRWQTQVENPVAAATTQKILKRENLFSDSFRKEYNKAFYKGDIDIGIAQGVYGSVRNKPVEGALLVGFGFASEKLFGLAAKGTMWAANKAPISIGFGSKVVTSAKVASFGIKSAPYVLGGAYAAGKTYDLFSAKTQYEKGKVLGGAIFEVGAMGIGSGIYQGVKSYRANRAFIKEAEKVPFKEEWFQNVVQGKNVQTIAYGTKQVQGKTYWGAVEQYGIIQKGGYQSIKGSNLMTGGFKGNEYKIVRSDISSFSENLGTGRAKKSTDLFSIFGKKKISTSLSYTEIKPYSVETMDIKGNDIFGSNKLPKSTFTRSMNFVTRTGKNTFNFVSVQAEKMRLWKTEPKYEILGSKNIAYGSGKTIKVKDSQMVKWGAAEETPFDFVYSGKTKQGWLNPQKWTSDLKVTKTTAEPSGGLFNFATTSKPSKGSFGNMEWGSVKKGMGLTPQLTSVQKAPTYVGGEGKSVSLFAGQGSYESGVSGFIGQTYAPPVSFGPSGRGMMFSGGLLSGFDFKDRFKSKPADNVRFNVLQTPNIKSGFAIKQFPIQIQPQKPISKTSQALKIQQVQIMETPQIFQPIIPMPITPTPVSPRGGFFKMPPMFNLPSGAGFGSSFNFWGKTKKRPYKYQPSMTAILFGIKGKQSKSSVTGFSIRPIPITKSRGRKK